MTDLSFDGCTHDSLCEMIYRKFDLRTSGRNMDNVQQLLGRAITLIKSAQSPNDGWDRAKRVFLDELAGAPSDRQFNADILDDAQPQGPRTVGKAFHQIAHDEGKPDLAALWQAVIENTKGGGFWLGEILLTTIEQETGFNGSAQSHPERGGK